LAFAAEGPAPPASLRSRILEAARADRPAEVIPLPRRRWAFPAAAAIAAAAASVAIGLGLWAASLSHSLDRERDALARAQNAQVTDALALNGILNKDNFRTPLSGSHSHGVLSVTPFRDATLIVCDPLRAPAGKTFEVWVIRRKTPRPAGLFSRVEGKCVVLNLTRRVPEGATVAVTIERAGGVNKPTTPILFRAQAA
jgi:hypothetical protein